ncbi:MAG TPA: hypothetical protein VGC13_25755 [Longimicrobium sp.]|jgi:hypothetical protein|uniref:hypothetical protein n=1 Tax=Longimicrobium sp. TaxID=2029185 RepID=UPI002ED87A44
MLKVTRGLRSGFFGALTVAALGFGTTQALAAPAAPADAQVCNPQVCNRICQSIPGSIGGFCTSDGSCQCYI